MKDKERYIVAGKIKAARRLRVSPAYLPLPTTITRKRSSEGKNSRTSSLSSAFDQFINATMEFVKCECSPVKADAGNHLLSVLN